jgi:hypothetical protein
MSFGVAQADRVEAASVAFGSQSGDKRRACRSLQKLGYTAFAYGYRLIQTESYRDKEFSNLFVLSSAFKNLKSCIAADDGRCAALKRTFCR